MTIIKNITHSTATCFILFQSYAFYKTLKNISELYTTLSVMRLDKPDILVIDEIACSSRFVTELRAVLIGRQHCGKTSVINTILETRTEAEGDEDVKREGFIDGRRVSLVETPGWWKTFNPIDYSNLSKLQLIRRTYLISPGPHAVLIVIRADSAFTDTDWRFLEEHLELLGPNVWTHTLVIFTRGDLIKTEVIEQRIQEEGSALKRLIEKCENKYHVFNNTNHHDRTQVEELFNKIEGIVRKNNGKHFNIDLKKVKEVNEQWEETQTRANSRKSRGISNQELISPQRNSPDHQQGYKMAR
uniref:AIG1-type G domain-containing protein n=1 Tax=Cyprinus carpio TaxID=7962 RepID=A0A8C2INH5_CYPCA